MTEIAFALLDPERDLDLVRGWMREPHVARWWQLAGPTEGEPVRDYLRARQALGHLDCWIVSDDGSPFAYVETYRIPDDPLAEHYDAEPGDRGFRLLVGPPQRLGHGAAQHLVVHLVTRLLDQFGITRILCAPDVANTRMVALCRSLGAEEVAALSLDGDSVLLLGWRRAPRA
ncbi:MAG: acetyltransferase [Actinomycetota bacterium]|nr:acetyltransferase [Actinomycetota bacterium]